LKKLSPDTEYGTSSYHMVFAGNPGTGKTMIAGLVGKLLVALELIPSSYFHVVQLHEIKAKYLGQTPHLMAETFKRPGVYFIDEAYSIKTRDDDSFGGEILSGLCEIAENRRDEIVIILAGYKKEMEELFEQNPGLVSRFHWIFDFADYSSDDLAQIGSFTARRMKHKFSEDALEEFRKDLADGGLNAREVRNYVEEVEFCQCVRTGKMKEYSLEVLLTFTVDDVITARKHRMTSKKSKTTEKQKPSLIMKTTHGDLRVQLDTGDDGGKK
jgi:stage V sporulation protein K